MYSQSKIQLLKAKFMIDIDKSYLDWTSMNTRESLFRGIPKLV